MRLRIGEAKVTGRSGERPDTEPKGMGMGRLELMDKKVDWVSVTREYLYELRDENTELKRKVLELQWEIDFLQHEYEHMEDQVATALAEIARIRVGKRKAPVYRKKAA